MGAYVSLPETQGRFGPDGLTVSVQNGQLVLWGGELILDPDGEHRFRPADGSAIRFWFEVDGEDVRKLLLWRVDPRQPDRAASAEQWVPVE